MGFFDKLKSGLKKTKDALLKPVNDHFSSYDKVDDDFYDELLDLLIMADVGVETSDYLVEELRARLKEKKIKETSLAREEFRAILAESVGESGSLSFGDGLNVILIIGVNGVGKTTSIGKITHCLTEEGKKVMLAAADTFRAGAIEQLNIWAERVGADIVKHTEGSDPAAVVFDAISAAKNRGCDVVIVDTAGRLHNKKNLMDELAKINRVIGRELPDASRETLLVLDATTGQNAVNQAKEFKNAAAITGLVVTKLDGSAKGGIVFSIKKELGLPIKYIGVGEKADDMEPFDAKDFVKALFE